MDSTGKGEPDLRQDCSCRQLPLQLPETDHSLNTTVGPYVPIYERLVDPGCIRLDYRLVYLVEDHHEN
jgi:hypothetical protein